VRQEGTTFTPCTNWQDEADGDLAGRLGDETENRDDLLDGGVWKFEGETPNSGGSDTIGFGVTDGSHIDAGDRHELIGAALPDPT
jgi:hypothetical protein